MEAYLFTSYGVLDATREHMRGDAVQDTKLGLVFPCRLNMKLGVRMIKQTAKSIQTGMSVTAEIKKSDRRMIDFLLSALARGVEEAGKER